MRKYCIIAVSFCLFLTTGLCQQGNLWYFGTAAGLDFSTFPPKPLFNSAMNAREGCSVMCDENGRLLFYTDGSTIYNRQHKVMASGLLGHPSSSQSCIIVPKPGSQSNSFYIFTSDAYEDNGLLGYNYTEVNMLMNGGVGGVTANRNIFLNGPSSERLTAIQAADKSSYWVITNNWSSNVFYAWKVDCKGISTVPVIST